MTALPLSITEDDVLTSVRAFLLSILPNGIEIFQGQNNRVAEPVAFDFVVMTPRSRSRLATNESTWLADDVAPAGLAVKQSTLFVLQLDIHGPAGSDNAQTIATLWRDDFACLALEPAGIAPLYSDDARQMPFINGENQYENRWAMDIALHASPVVSTPQQFADTLAASIRGLS